MAAISNFWQRVITGILFLLIMIGAIVWSHQSFLILFGIVTILATYEYLKITSLFSSPNKWLVYLANIVSYGYVASTLLFMDSEFQVVTQQALLLCYILFPILMFVAEIFRKKDKAFDNIAYSILGFIYITLPFTLLIQIFAPGSKTYNYQIILAYFLILWTTDTLAYVWGKLLGKHKLAPHISAGKTVEGSLGSMLSMAGLTFLFPFIFPSIQFTHLQWVIFALLIAIFSLPGDLSESLLKRQAGVKDSGKILPGHGGILDRFDSVLLTAPIIYLYLQILQRL